MQIGCTTIREGELVLRHMELADSVVGCWLICKAYGCEWDTMDPGEAFFWLPVQKLKVNGQALGTSLVAW